MKQRHKSELVVAHHEAGHAAACFELRRRVRYIRLNDSGPEAGIVQCAGTPGIDLRRRDRRDRRNRNNIEREVMIYFAGLVAEEMFTGKRNLKGLSEDFNAVYALTRCENTRPDEVIAYGRWLYERTVTLIGRNFAAVSALAHALAERKELSGTEARRLYFAAKRRKPRRAVSQRAKQR